MIRFFLNEELINIDQAQAAITVLSFLRNHRYLCGTKEGCASGDCGACTVVVAELTGTQLQYKNINSCITFVGSLHGKQLLTVEHLKKSDQLHPVQAGNS